ncbi:MAG: phage holin family protein [Clostridiales bacterium]|nr:phage holin family protein [Clostridiales bacterium]
MKLKDRIKSKSFWAGLIGSVFLMLSAFGVDVGDQTASAIVNAVCSLLVVLGIVVTPAASEVDRDGQATVDADTVDLLGRLDMCDDKSFDADVG